MENNNFSSWFKKEGWKKYVGPYALYAFVLTKVVQSIIIYPESYVESAEAVVWSCLGAIAILGFGIGITWHMIRAYRDSEK